MAETLPPLVGHLLADISGFRAGLGEATAIAKKETTASATAFNGLATIGKAAFLGLGVAAIVGGGAAVKMAGDYESATNRLVTSAGESAKAVTDSSGKVVGGLELVRKGMLDMAGQVGISAQDLAKGMYIVESAGQHGAAGLTVLRAAAEGAKTENADLATVANAVTSALQDYHLPASSAAQVTTTLVAAVSQGKTTFADLTGAMHAVLPIASAAHISLADITAAMASMTVHGMSAEQSAQNMAHAIQHLQTVTAPQGKELAALGISARQLSNDLGKKGLTGTLEEISTAIQAHMGANGQVVLKLTDALKGLPPEVQKLGAAAASGTISMGDYAKAAKGLSVEAAGQAAGFATLLKSTHGIGQDQKSGADIMQSYAAALKAATGDSTGLNVALMLTGENSAYTAGAVKAVSAAVVEGGNHVAGWVSIQATFNQRIDRLTAGLGALAITIGTALLPYVSAAIDKMMGLADWLGKNTQVSIPLAAALGGVLLVAIGAYTIAMAQAAIATIAATWPLLLVVAAVALVAAGLTVLIMHWQQIRQWIVNVAAAISHAIEQHKALAVALMILGGPITLIIGIGALLITHWRQIQSAAAALASSVVGHWNSLKSLVVQLVTGIVTTVGAFFSHLGSMASTAWAEFTRHPVYWIGFLLAYVPIKLLELIAAVVVWGYKLHTQAMDAASKFVIAVIVELERLPGQIADWLSRVIPEVLRWAGDMASKGGKAALDFATAVTTELYKLPSQVWSIGVSIAQGIIGGLKSLIPDAIKAAGDFIHGLVGGANAAAGNPKSPAPVTIPLGLSLAQGVQEGVRVGSPAARGAMAGLIGDMSGTGVGSGWSGSASLGGSAGAGGSGGGTVINVYVTTNADPRRIGDEVVWAMKYGGVGAVPA